MTVLGKHTIAETNDLISQIEWRVDAINAAFKQISTAKMGEADPNLPSDWQMFLIRWINAKNVARAALAALRAAVSTGGLAVPGIGSIAALAPDSTVPAEGIYNGILLAQSPTYPAYTSTDLAGLQQRIQALNPITFPPQPQNVSWDMDLKAYNTADSAAQGINSVANSASNAGKGFFEDNAGKIILAALAGLAVLIIAKK